jgi:tyrosine-protein phosphatase MSG5
VSTGRSFLLALCLASLYLLFTFTFTLNLLTYLLGTYFTFHTLSPKQSNLTAITTPALPHPRPSFARLNDPSTTPSSSYFLFAFLLFSFALPATKSIHLQIKIHTTRGIAHQLLSRSKREITRRYQQLPSFRPSFPHSFDLSSRPTCCSSLYPSSLLPYSSTCRFPPSLSLFEYSGIQKQSRFPSRRYWLHTSLTLSLTLTHSSPSRISKPSLRPLRRIILSLLLTTTYHYYYTILSLGPSSIMACSASDANVKSLKRTFGRSETPPQIPRERLAIDNSFTSHLIPSKLLQQRMSLSLKRRYPFNKSPSIPPPKSPTAKIHPLSEQTSQEFNKTFTFGGSVDADVDMSEEAPRFAEHKSSISGVVQPPNAFEIPTNPFPRRHPLQPPNQETPPTSIPSSTNCSPTTTISTVDSSVADYSPVVSSTDSPVSIMPLSALKHLPGLPSTDELSIVPPSPGLGPEYNSRSLSPSKKPRNTKNLSLNVPPPSTPFKRPQTADAGTGSARPSPRSMSAPNSPAFIVPPPPPRRRPSNLGLTIKLPATIAERRSSNANNSTLRHHQSSPSLFSPATGGPPGGMRFPSSATFQQRAYQPSKGSALFQTVDSIPSSNSSSNNSYSPPRSPMAMALPEMEEEDEPLSHEARSPAYPQGPVLIFEPNIYLFAEPDADLAGQFDVVINVAREVLNPFDARNERERKESVYTVPDTAATDSSFMTAQTSLVTPTMDTAKEKLPEYHHIPWDHNSSLLEDLPRLVKLIDSRASEGKKILVHCQCGVSRSASLLIAYGMYKNPTKTVQEAYDTVKNKSRWIGPNMSLIYQLSDWRTQLLKPGAIKGFSWKNKGGQTIEVNGGVKGLMKGNGTFGRGDEDDDSESQVPQTAPLPGRPGSLPSPPLENPSVKIPRHGPKFVRTNYMQDISPGPSSAPPGLFIIPKPPASPSPSIGSTRSAREPEMPPFDEQMDSVSTSAPNSYIPPSSLQAALRNQSNIDAHLPAVPPTPSAFQSTFSNPFPTSHPHHPVPRAIIPEDALIGFGLPRKTKLTPKAEAPEGAQENVLQQAPAFRSPRNSGYFGFAMSKTGFFGQGAGATDAGGFVFADPRSPSRNMETPVVRSIFDVL